MEDNKGNELVQREEIPPLCSSLGEKPGWGTARRFTAQLRVSFSSSPSHDAFTRQLRCTRQRYPVIVCYRRFMLPTKSELFGQFHTQNVLRAGYLFTKRFFSSRGSTEANINHTSAPELCTTNFQSLPLIMTQVNWISLQCCLPDASMCIKVQKWWCSYSNICT